MRANSWESLTPDQKAALIRRYSKTQDQEIEEFAKASGDDGYDLTASALGQGKFRDTGRASSGYGESIDSLIGAPARMGISELQDGNIKQALLKTMAQIGKDPEQAPTGVDIAMKATDNPYLGTALATAVDVGAQLPMPVGAGVQGIIKKLDGPLYHGSPKSFPADKIKPSRGGYVGPGVYMADDAKVAGGYGENVHAYNPKNPSILDFTENNDDVMLAAQQLGLDQEAIKARLGKQFGNPAQTGRFYALQDELINKIDPEHKLIGNERAEALVNALKEQGHTGFKYTHNEKPAYNIFDEKSLKPAHKYTVRAKEDGLNLYSEPARASGSFLDPDSVAEMDPEIMEHLEKAGVDPKQLFRLETLESDISGYGAKALKKMEESAKKRGAEVSYLNAAPMGYLGKPAGMTQEQSAAKLRDYYQSQGYETVKDYGSNTMMLKRLKALMGPITDDPAILSAIRQKREKEKRD